MAASSSQNCQCASHSGGKCATTPCCDQAVIKLENCGITDGKPMIQIENPKKWEASLRGFHRKMKFP